MPCQPSLPINPRIKRVYHYEWHFLVKHYHCPLTLYLTQQLLQGIHIDMANPSCCQAYAGFWTEQGRRIFFLIQWHILPLMGPSKNVWIDLYFWDYVHPPSKYKFTEHLVCVHPILDVGIDRREENKYYDMREEGTTSESKSI